jgi:hypothetical protein
MLRTFEEYSVHNITVTVEWIQQVGAVYTSSVLPPAPLMFNGSSSVQLVLEYNTVYNLSVIMAVASCGVSTETFIVLHYGETQLVAFWQLTCSCSMHTHNHGARGTLCAPDHDNYILTRTYRACNIIDYCSTKFVLVPFST